MPLQVGALTIIVGEGLALSEPLTPVFLCNVPVGGEGELSFQGPCVLCCVSSSLQHQLSIFVLPCLGQRPASYTRRKMLKVEEK